VDPIQEELFTGRGKLNSNALARLKNLEQKESVFGEREDRNVFWTKTHETIKKHVKAQGSDMVEVAPDRRASFASQRGVWKGERDGGR